MYTNSIDFFIADTHFGHTNIITHCNRPFTDAEHMTGVLVHAWNSAVKNSDRVFILGDFSFYNLDITQKLLQKLNGQKFLIKGNHDKSKIIKQLPQFAKISDYDELKITIGEVSTRVIMSHFPFLSWNQMHRGAYHFHGHCHGTLVLPASLKNAKIFDVGVDNLNKVFGSWAPAPLDTILLHLNSREAANS